MKLSSLVIILVVSSVAFGEGRGDELLKTRLSDTSLLPETKAALALVLPAENATVEELLVVSSKTIQLLPFLLRKDVTRWVSARKLAFDLKPFEIEAYREQGVLPKPSLGSDLERLPIADHFKFWLKKAGISTIGELQQTPPRKLTSLQIPRLVPRVRNALEIVMEKDVHGPSVSALQLYRNRLTKRRLTRAERIQSEKDELNFIKSQKKAETEIRRAQENKSAADRPSPGALNILRENGLTDLSELKYKSQKWIDIVFPLTGPRGRWTRAWNDEIKKYILERHGEIAMDDLESAIMENKLSRPVDPTLMNLSPELLSEFRDFKTVRSLINQTERIAADRTVPKSEAFKTFSLRLKIYLDRCNARLAQGKPE